jgi:hypothetical protein
LEQQTFNENERKEFNSENNDEYMNRWSCEANQERYTSPVSSLPIHELKMLKQYIDGYNLKLLGSSLPHYKKGMMLLRFLKQKRNQQVEIHSRRQGSFCRTLGKVSVIGRDFVVLTTLLDRIWIPYHYIDSAEVPFGLPDITDTHQQFLFDNNLRKKLLTQFGKTVSSREVLKQQFFEESLKTNLKTWIGTRVNVFVENKRYTGTIHQVENETLILKRFNDRSQIKVNKIEYMSSSRLLNLFLPFIHRVKQKMSDIFSRH